MLRSGRLPIIQRASFLHTFVDAIHPALIAFVDYDSATSSRPYWVTCALKRHNRIGELFETDVPGAIQEAIRCGNVGWILDNSLEAPLLSRSCMNRWHEDVRQLGLFQANIVYLSQNVLAAEVYEAFCLRTQATKVIRCGYYHFFHKKLALRVAAMRIGQRRAFARASRQLKSPGDPNFRRFVSLNHRVRHFRLAFLLSLARDGLLQDGHVSFGGLTQEALIMQQRPAAERGPDPIATILADPQLKDLAQFYPRLSTLDGQMVDRKHIRINEAGKLAVADLVYSFQSEVYRHSYFTVVTETEMVRGMNRITEKPIKPLLNNTPFLIFGNYQSLSLLRALGFKSFSCFDESYDSILDPYERFSAAYDEFRRLLALPGSAWTSIRAKLANTLAENQDYALNGFLSFLVSSMDGSLAAALVNGDAKLPAPAPSNSTLGERGR